jgi:hypothetical protein
MAGDQPEPDALQGRAQTRQVARKKRRHGLARRDPHGPLGGVGETGAATVDRFGRLLHGPGVGQQLFAGGGQHEAVGQPIEQPGADGVLQRLDAPGDGRMADPELAGRAVRLPSRDSVRNTRRSSQSAIIRRHSLASLYRNVRLIF